LLSNLLCSAGFSEKSMSPLKQHLKVSDYFRSITKLIAHDKELQETKDAISRRHINA
jgi:hypothetical protein